MSCVKVGGIGSIVRFRATDLKQGGKIVKRAGKITKMKVDGITIEECDTQTHVPSGHTYTVSPVDIVKFVMPGTDAGKSEEAVCVD